MRRFRMITKRARFIALAVALLLVALTGLVACEGKKEEKMIDVFAAASLTDCMRELGTNSVRRIRDKVQFNFESSGTLQTGMEGTL